MVARGRACSGADYYRAIMTVHGLGRSLAPFFESHDLLLSPTLAKPPVRLGVLHTDFDDPMDYRREIGAFSPFTSIFNVTGQPAMSMPLQWSGTGLPLGSQFVARYGEEATLFRLAGQLEAARPWAERRPPGYF